jgi:hypothetical protein
MISVVTWKWRPPHGYRSNFSGEHVNVLRNMVARHYRKPHRFIVVTDDPSGIAPGIDVIPIWSELGELKSPHGSSNPSCYRRLRMFSADAARLFGPRFVSIDLDCVVTGDLGPIFDRPEPIVLWRHPTGPTLYNGSMILMSAGVRPRVWDDFDPLTSPRQAYNLGHRGSDQAWISACLGPNEATWSKVNGVFSHRGDVAPRDGALPPGARIVFFHGRRDPWGEEAQRLAWVREHWR